MMIRTFGPTKQILLEEYIKHPLSYTHGRQFKGIAAIVLAIIAKETGNQAELFKHAGQSGSRDKRFSRLIHNPRLAHESLAYRHRATRLAGLRAGYDQSAQRTNEACHLIARRLKLACVDKLLRSRNND